MSLTRWKQTINITNQLTVYGYLNVFTLKDYDEKFFTQTQY